MVNQKLLLSLLLLSGSYIRSADVPSPTDKLFIWDVETRQVYDVDPNALEELEAYLNEGKTLSEVEIRKIHVARSHARGVLKDHIQNIADQALQLIQAYQPETVVKEEVMKW